MVYLTLRFKSVIRPEFNLLLIYDGVYQLVTILPTFDEIKLETSWRRHAIVAFMVAIMVASMFATIVASMVATMFAFIVFNKRQRENLQEKLFVTHCVII